MTRRPTCAEDECENIVESEQVELIEVPVEGTDEWETIQYGVCTTCREREQRLLEELSVE